MDCLVDWGEHQSQALLVELEGRFPLLRSFNHGEVCKEALCRLALSGSIRMVSERDVHWVNLLSIFDGHSLFIKVEDDGNRNCVGTNEILCQKSDDAGVSGRTKMERNERARLTCAALNQSPV